MAVYFILLILPIVPALIFSKYKNDYFKKLSISLFFITFIAILALRSYEVGIDLDSYKLYFNSIKEMSWDKLTNYDIEIGYVIFNKLISYISDNFQILLILCSLITVVPIFVLYITEAKIPYLSIIIFANMSTFVMMFSGLRQAIAISIGVIAFCFVKKRKPILFIITVLLAITFHSSAFILFIMYPLYHSKITKKWLWFVIPSMLLTFVFNKQIFNFTISFLGKRYIERYSSITNTNAYAMIALFAIFLIFSYFMNNDRQIDTSTLGLRNILVFILIIQLFAPINSIAMRLNYYFIIYIPILISKVINKPRESCKRLAQISNIIIVAFFTIYFFYNAYTGNDILHVFPYKFFWE